MSHFTKIKTKLYNLDILKKSLNDLALETEVGAKEIRGYNNQKHFAELIIKQSNNQYKYRSKFIIIFKSIGFIIQQNMYDTY